MLRGIVPPEIAAYVSASATYSSNQSSQSRSRSIIAAPLNPSARTFEPSPVTHTSPSPCSNNQNETHLQSRPTTATSPNPSARNFTPTVSRPTTAQSLNSSARSFTPCGSSRQVRPNIMNKAEWKCAICGVECFFETMGFREDDE